MDTIILASGSPRRRQLLASTRLPFRAVSPEAPEDRDGHDLAELVRGNARRKVQAVSGMLRPEGLRWVLGVDTVVAIDGAVLGKPAKEEEAAAMLRRLSGRVHQVWSGLALLVEQGRPLETAVATTEVEFRKLDEAELRRYLATGEWAGAAGGYRIQERGVFLVQSIRGSWSNVVGLPLEEFYGMLKRNGYPF